MNTLRSELRKMMATKTWIWLTVAAVLLTTGIVALIFLGLKSLGSGGNGDLGLSLRSQAGVEQVYSAVGIFLGWLFALVLGAIAGTGEFRFGTIVPTLLATPKRERPALAKFAAVAIVSGLMGACVVAVGYISATLLLLTTSHASPSYSNLALNALGCMLAYVLLGIVGVSFGILVRNQIAAVVVVIVWVVVAQNVLNALAFLAHFERYAKFFPQNAVTAIVGAASRDAQLLSPVGGALTLLAYALVFSILAFTITLRRDVG